MTEYNFVCTIENSTVYSALSTQTYYLFILFICHTKSVLNYYYYKYYYMAEHKSRMIVFVFVGLFWNWKQIENRRASSLEQFQHRCKFFRVFRRISTARMVYNIDISWDNLLRRPLNPSNFRYSISIFAL